METAGSNEYGQCAVSEWKLFDDLENIEEERRKKMSEVRQRENYRAWGVCQHCGGEFKGLFRKKCSVCGREKDY